MRAWRARGPAFTAYRGVTLRIVTYRLFNQPDEDDRRKLVVQALGQDGKPVADDPLLEAVVQPEEVAAYLEASIEDGWRLEPERALHAVLGPRKPCAAAVGHATMTHEHRAAGHRRSHA